MESSNISIKNNINTDYDNTSSNNWNIVYAEKNLTIKKIWITIISLSTGIGLLTGLFIFSIAPIIIGALGIASTIGIIYGYLKSTKDFKSIIKENKRKILEKKKEKNLKEYNSESINKTYSKKPVNANKTFYDIACSDIPCSHCMDDLIDPEIDSNLSHRKKHEYFD